jgi:isoleucyl-tRNA synthetase
LRYLLGALDGWTEAERVAVEDMPELERWVLHRLAELDAELRVAVAAYDFAGYVGAIARFASDDLSALVFDIRKDCLYCDAPSSMKRRAYRTVLAILFDALTKWLSPVLVFTSEEAWGLRFPGAGSVHVEGWPEIDTEWQDDNLGRRWFTLRELRLAVNGAIEPRRFGKEIGSSLEAAVSIELTEYDVQDYRQLDLSELLIVARADLIAAPLRYNVNVSPTSYARCARCWRHRPEVGHLPDPNLCDRCYDVVSTHYPQQLSLAA